MLVAVLALLEAGNYYPLQFKALRTTRSGDLDHRVAECDNTC